VTAIVEVAAGNILPAASIFRANPSVSGFSGFFGNRREPVAEQGV
jgi:hypothetical protein